MKTSWILLAALASLHLAACGGQASDDGRDRSEEEGEEDTTAEDQGEDMMEGEQPSEGEDVIGAPAGELEDINEDGDIDEDDRELAAVEEVFGVELRDADEDGDIDRDDVIELLEDEYDEDELDLDGDGDFDEQDIAQVQNMVPQPDSSAEAVDTPPMAAEMPPLMADDGIIITEGATPVPAAQAPRGMPGGVFVGPGVPSGGSTGGFVDLDTCTEDYRNSGPDYCEVGYQCEVGYAYGSCYNQGNGLLYCDCGSDLGWASFQLEDVATAEACPTLMDLCGGEIEPEFTAESECVPEYQSASGEYCDMQLRCSQSAELDGGGTALLSQYESVSCGRTDDGTRQCSCYGQNGSMTFEIDGGSGLDSCVAGMDICQSAEPVETDEPADCEIEYQSSSQTWCDAQLACNKTATVGDVEVEIAEGVSTNCQQIEPGQWMCACYSSTESRTFELASSASAWDTCTTAVETCAQ